MFVILGVRRVKPEFVDEYVKAHEEMTRTSLAEPGCITYDLLRDNDDPCVFILYEKFTDEAAARAHQQAPHHDRWKQISAGWYEEPHRIGRWEGTTV